MLRKITCAIALTVTAAVASAQNTEQSFTIATEMFSPALAGFIVEGGCNLGKNRIAISYSQIEVPEFYNSQSNLFTVSRDYVDVFYTRFLKDDQRGFHYGLSLGYILNEQATEIRTDFQGEKDYIRAGLRFGYFWQPFVEKENALKGLFLEPAINIGFALSDQNIVFPSTTFESSILKISGPLFHLGYKF